MSAERRELGLLGERLAERFLKRKGMSVVARRFTAPTGEIDLIMRDGGTLVFVEVKARRDRRWTEPQHAVNIAKQRKIARTARSFLARHRRFREAPCRIDVVAVIVPEQGAPQLTHFPDAFMPEKW